MLMPKNLTPRHVEHEQVGILLPCHSCMISIAFDDIVHLEGIRNYTIFYLTDGSLQISARTLKVFEQELPFKQFYRTHKSHLINLKHLYQYDTDEHKFAIMSNARKVLISRRKRKEFVSRILLSSTPTDL